MSSVPPLAQLRPRDSVSYVSCNRYRVNGRQPEPVGISNIEEHSQIAYYVFESPNADQDLFRGALIYGRTTMAGLFIPSVSSLRALRFK